MVLYDENPVIPYREAPHDHVQSRIKHQVATESEGKDGRKRGESSHCASHSKGHVRRGSQAAQSDTSRQLRQNLRHPSDDLGSLERNLQATVLDLHLLRRLLVVSLDRAPGIEL